MTTLSVAFGASLTVTDTVPTAGFWLPEDGVGQIARDIRRTYATDSAYYPGKVLLAAVEDAGTVPLTIYAQAATSAALQTLRDQLEAAALQWSYDLTITVDGVAKTYNAELAMPVWTALDSGMARAHIDRCALSIPVNP